MLKGMASGLVLTLAMAGTVSADTVLRFAEGSPNRGSRAEAVEHFMEEVKQLSDGTLTFDIHWGGALLDYKTMTDGVSRGTADMGTMLAAYTPQKLKALTIGDIPVGSSDPWVGTRAMYELMTTNKTLQELLARQGLVYVTGYSSTGVQFECGGGHSIRTVDDIKGKRVRAIATYAKVLDELGASLVNITAGDFYQSLDTGLVDCSASYLYTIRTLKTYEVIDNVTLVNWGQINGFATLMNLYAWEDLSKEEQAIIREAGSNAIDYSARLQIEEMELVVDGLKTGSIGRKVTVYEMAEEERAKLEKVAERYARDWIDSITRDGVNGQKIWDEYQALLMKYERELEAKGYPWERM
ncbi:C4-dicarboxylate TRAP transporter substrate-binding protein [Marinobacter litoralis]|uniref:C4-dicarboxylate TRAP transporter substrate-binding protein n=1 Tax=Marinobacter litoralis TaxID=187981 RepID=UPI0018ED43A0|nr:C4-dicarboxylate TRAP transporter substrate-binding protein [Marinobacter litoralis]MBJ6136082.1 C4-dicarboxylate TRAP transporter substrate-binding protein [Marinobacter litoralis]